MQQIVRVAFALLWTSIWMLLGVPAHAIDYGTPVPKGKFTAVGQVRIYDTDGHLLSAGTGTLIGPDLVLTAAHVIFPVVTPWHIEFVLSEGDGRRAHGLAYRICPKHLNFSQADSVTTLHKLFTWYPWEVAAMRKASVASDIALVKLDRPIGGVSSFLPLTQQDPIAGAVVTVVGFGKDETDSIARHRKLMGDLKLKKRQDNVLYFVAADDRFQMTDYGDSGGPLLLKKGNSHEICALVQGGDFVGELADVTADSYGKFVSVAHHQKWIQRSIEDLEQIQAPAAERFYLQRQEARGLFSAVTLSQWKALIDVGTPGQRLIERIVVRGMSDPLTEGDVKVFTEKVKMPAKLFGKVSSDAAERPN